MAIFQDNPNELVQENDHLPFLYFCGPWLVAGTVQCDLSLHDC